MIKTVTVNGQLRALYITSGFFQGSRGWEIDSTATKVGYIGTYSTVSNVVRAFKNQKRTEDEIVAMAHFIVNVGGWGPVSMSKWYKRHKAEVDKAVEKICGSTIPPRRSQVQKEKLKK